MTHSDLMKAAHAEAKADHAENSAWARARDLPVKPYSHYLGLAMRTQYAMRATDKLVHGFQIKGPARWLGFSHK